MPAQKLKAIDPWAKLDALMEQESEPTGDEWFTTDQFAKRYDVAWTTAMRKLKGMTLKGTLEKWSGRRELDGRTVTKYRLKL